MHQRLCDSHIDSPCAGFLISLYVKKRYARTMNTITQQESCDGDCNTCTALHGHDMPAGAPGPYQGMRLACWSFFFFILPLLCSIAGSILTNFSNIGGIGGLVSGIILCAVFARKRDDSTTTKDVHTKSTPSSDQKRDVG